MNLTVKKKQHDKLGDVWRMTMCLNDKYYEVGPTCTCEGEAEFYREQFEKDFASDRVSVTGESINIDENELIDEPMWWHLQGYEAHPREESFMEVPTIYKYHYKKYKRRIYYSRFMGLDILWIRVKKEKIPVNIDWV